VPADRDPEAALERVLKNFQEAGQVDHRAGQDQE
jgi:hypothetical protein